jgi:hypothetical protein
MHAYIVSRAKTQYIIQIPQFKLKLKAENDPLKIRAQVYIQYVCTIKHIAQYC